jgi:hypothetical protein
MFRRARAREHTHIQQREQLAKAAVEQGGSKLLFRWQEEIDGAFVCMGVCV